MSNSSFMGKLKLSFWDALLWVGAVLVLVWALLKALGWIHSPVWVEMVPFFGAGASLVGASYKLGKMAKGIEDTQQKVDQLVKIEDRFKLLEHEHNLCKDGKMHIPHNRDSHSLNNNRRF
jgi:hypothetical protein